MNQHTTPRRPNGTSFPTGSLVLYVVILGLVAVMGWLMGLLAKALMPTVAHQAMLGVVLSTFYSVLMTLGGDLCLALGKDGVISIRRLAPAELREGPLIGRLPFLLAPGLVAATVPFALVGLDPAFYLIVLLVAVFQSLVVVRETYRPGWWWGSIVFPVRGAIRAALALAQRYVPAAELEKALIAVGFIGPFGLILVGSIDIAVEHLGERLVQLFASSPESAITFVTLSPFSVPFLIVHESTNPGPLATWTIVGCLVAMNALVAYEVHCARQQPETAPPRSTPVPAKAPSQAAGSAAPQRKATLLRMLCRWEATKVGCTLFATFAPMMGGAMALMEKTSAGVEGQRALGVGILLGLFGARTLAHVNHLVPLDAQGRILATSRPNFFADLTFWALARDWWFVGLVVVGIVLLVGNSPLSQLFALWTLIAINLHAYPYLCLRLEGTKASSAAIHVVLLATLLPFMGLLVLALAFFLQDRVPAFTPRQLIPVYGVAAAYFTYSLIVVWWARAYASRATTAKAA